MGRTLPSITQLALDELFVAARQHLAAAAYAANLLPMETFLLAMLLEEHKQIIHLRNQMEALQSRFENG
jgi:hypothetical protein